MKNVFIFFVLLLIIIGCEKQVGPDTTPPTVTIISPQTGSIVNEIVPIVCISADNKGVEKVELWINGEATDVIDNTEPYSLDWITYTYEDDSYVITVRSYDTSNNKTDSDPIILIVDNSGSFPTSVELYPILYQNDSYIISWSQNNDDDFYSYKLYESFFEDMSNNSLLYETNSNADTSYIEILAEDIKYYQVTIENEWEMVSYSNIQIGTPYIIFTTTYGTSYNDVGYLVKQTFDNGYIITGKTESLGNGESDIWLVKTDYRGNEESNQTFGGVENDEGYSIYITNDNGYIIAGSTYSFGSGLSDFWIIKTDSNGNEEWNRTFGGGSYDCARSIQQTTDNGYIIAGYTWSFGNGQTDMWLIKTDQNGNEEWNQTFGGIWHDRGFSVPQPSGDGSIIARWTSSFGNGDDDAWLIKTDSQGNEEWNQTFGGSLMDQGFDVQITYDGGYVITGFTKSFSGQSDIWLIKTDQNGNEEWSQTYGGNDSEHGNSVQQTVDGGYIITGYTESFGIGLRNVWLLMTDSNGNEIWNNTIGPSIGNSVQQTSDNGFIITGQISLSYPNSGSNFGLIKTDPNGNTVQ